MMSKDAFVHYMTHNETLDEHHWELFTMMDSVIKELHAEEDDKAIPHLEVLLCKLSEHITTETKIMDDAQYPFRAHHQEDHGKMFTLIGQVKQNILEKQRIDEWTISKMQSLFINHIDYHDIQMARWIAEHQLEKANG
jgi:hemerythrin-like metal-binding protein